MRDTLEAKKRLYSLLLDKHKPTKNEIDLMYLLAKDKEIQQYFTNKNKKLI